MDSLHSFTQCCCQVPHPRDGSVQRYRKATFRRCKVPLAVMFVARQCGPEKWDGFYMFLQHQKSIKIEGCDSKQEFCRTVGCYFSIFVGCVMKQEWIRQGISYWKLMRVLFPIARGPVKVPLNHYLTSKLVKQTH